MNIDKSYLFRYFKGNLSETELKELDRWVGESEKNEKLFHEAHAEYDYLTLYADMDVLERMEPEEVTKRKKVVRTFIRFFSSAAAVAVFFVLAVTVAKDIVADRISNSLVSVEVPAGQRLTITMPDGTKVSLNAGSRLEYPPIFYGKERRVILEGEGAFDVAHDTGHPFVVETYAADVTALGTEFNVLADSEDREFSATLIEGSVKVTGRNSDKDILLVPDQTVSLEEGRFNVESCHAAESVKWVYGVISIGGMDFATLMKRFEKSFGVSVVIERDRMPELECAEGEVYVSDGILQALKVLQHLTDFEYRKDNRTNTVHIY